MLAFLLCFFQMQAQDFRTTSDDSDFEVIDGRLIGYHGAGGDVVIPDHLGITIIGEAFVGNNTITSVIIPNGVTAIDAAAFVYCGNLASVTLPNSVEIIGFRSFLSCPRLKSVTLPNSLKRIESWAFSGCSSFTSITIPESVEYIGECNFVDCNQLTEIKVNTGNTVYTSVEGVLYDINRTILYCYPAKKSGTAFSIPGTIKEISTGAFSGCSDLTSITIPNTVAHIGNAAFYFCSNLVTLTIPNSVVTIGDKVFDYSNQLLSIHVDEGNTVYSSNAGVLYNKDQTTLLRCPEGKNGIVPIPDTVKDIADRAFLSCTKLTSITLPNRIETIGEGAFASCENLASVTLSNSVASIGNNAFHYCSALTSIEIPNSVKTIGENAFLYCTRLTAIHVDEGNTNYSSIEGVLYNKEQTVLYNYPSSKSGAEFSIPTSVTEISSWACYYCQFKSIIIPKSVKTIGNYAFSNCIFLEDIIVYWTTPITIPESAFNRWYEGPYHLYVPIGTTGVYTALTANWANDFIISEQEPTSGISLDITTAYVPVNYTVKLSAAVSPRNATNKNVIWSSSAPSVANVSGTGIITPVKEGTATITATTEEGGFTATCKVTVANTDFIVINDVLTAYRGAGGNVLIPGNLGITEIKESVFENNQTIASVSIPKGVTKIGNKAFYKSSLTDISIPGSVESIGSYVFEECNHLSAINVDASNSYYSSKEGVLFNFYQSVLFIYPGGKPGPYTIPGSVMHIGYRAFSNCSALSSVKIPNSVISIEQSAFYGCDQLKDITVLRAIPLDISEYVFEGFNTNSCTLHVLEGSKKVYASADVWKTFGTIIDDVPFVFVTGVNLNRTTVTLFINDTELLIATVLPEDAVNKNVRWSSNNPSIATVSDLGIITAVSDGTAKITVTTEESGFTATCDVTVNKQTDIPNIIAEKGVYLYGGRLYVDSPEAETIRIYSVSGILLYEFRKPSGTADYPIIHTPNSILIVTGSSGWVKKLIMNYEL